VSAALHLPAQDRTHHYSADTGSGGVRGVPSRGEVGVLLHVCQPFIHPSSIRNCVVWCCVVAGSESGVTCTGSARCSQKRTLLCSTCFAASYPSYPSPPPPLQAKVPPLSWERGSCCCGGWIMQSCSRRPLTLGAISSVAQWWRRRRELHRHQNCPVGWPNQRRLLLPPSQRCTYCFRIAWGASCMSTTT